MPHDGVQSYHSAKPDTILPPFSCLVNASTWYPRPKLSRGVRQRRNSNDAIPQLYSGQHRRTVGIADTKTNQFGGYDTVTRRHTAHLPRMDTFVW